MRSGDLVRRDVSLSDKLRTIRRVTGKAFSTERGYDLRKGISKARARTIDKYYEMLVELTARPHQVITPPKGAKREAFEFTGQKKHPRFTKAFVHTPDPDAAYRYELDRARPKGSRFVQVNRITGERMWHIPAEVFIDVAAEYGEDIFAEGEEPDGSFFSEVIREYGEDGEVYVIQNGNYHMWGTAGTPDSVGDELAKLFRNYGAQMFNERDRNSHWIGNWFRGVEVFSDAYDFQPYFEDRVRAQARRAEARGSTSTQKIRRLKSGDIGLFDRGRLIQTIPSSSVKPTRPTRRR